jgi:transcriptional regulator with AAA-type ATPase domain
MPTATTAAARLIRDHVGNPFVAARPANPAQALKDLDLPALFDAALRRGNAEHASDLALAVAHAQVQAGMPPGGLLDDPVLPRSLARRLPRPRADYLKVAAAAGRCEKVLARIRGGSDAVQRARRHAWAICFGDTLRGALELERVIRDHDILILGETGTGKELFARAMQDAAPGAADGSPAPRAAINAAAIPETLVESELFGHVKGAFTGASETRSGRLRSADGGTLFLDEVGDLPSTTQVKLLRVIETNEVTPVGSDEPFTVDVRYIAATHRDLEGMVARGSFRRDLFERLAGNVLRIPPLRERPEDILEIGRELVAGYIPDPSAPQRAAVDGWLRSREARLHPWPGNVRELQNALRNLVLGLDPGLRRPDATAAPPAARLSAPEAIRRFQAPLDEVEGWYARAVLERAGGNLSRAARALAVDRATLRRKLARPPA